MRGVRRLVLPASLAALSFAPACTLAQPLGVQSQPGQATAARATAAAGPLLHWAPPALVNPITIQVGSRGGTLSLDKTRDYIIRISRVRHRGGLVLSGGHNVVVMGGEITIPWVGKHPKKGGGDRRGLGIFGAAGTVHVEGLLIDGRDLSEGIQIGAPHAVVQLENIRIVGIHARDEVHFRDNHPDLVQPWGGVRSLRIDRLTGSTDYQGLFLVGSLGPIGHVELRHVDILGKRTSRYLLWIDGPRVTISDLWLRPAPGRRVPNVIWPAGSAAIHQTHSGQPPGGPFVPLSTVGRRYVSPGYG
jgi:hypothetical protein